MSLKMNVLLIIPPPASIDCPSLGLAAIAGALKNSECGVRVLDLNILLHNSGKLDGALWQKEGFDKWCSESFCHSHWPITRRILDEQIRKARVRNSWQFIGLHVNYASKIYACLIVEYLRSQFPSAKFVAGGPAYFNDRDIDDRVNAFDAVFQGEADESLVQWMKSHPKNMAKDTPGPPEVVPPPAIHLHLDRLPAPYFEPFPQSGYARNNVLPMETGRGCPNRCAFCEDSRMWGGYRRKGNKKIEEDLLALQKEGAAHISFADSILNPQWDKFENFLKLMSSTDFSWDGMIQARGVNPDIAQKMKASRCRDVFIGIESFQSAFLKKLGKQNVSKNGAAAVASLAQHGINVSIGLIVAGPPLQTRQQFDNDKQTLTRLSALIESVAVNPLFIPPNTPLSEHAVSLGISGIGAENGWKFWHAGKGISDIESRLDWCAELIAHVEAIGISPGSNYNDFETYRRHQLSVARIAFGVNTP